MGPAQAHQVIEQGLGQVALIAIGHHAHRPVALGQARPVLPQDHGHMGVARHLPAQGAQDVDLARGVVDVVVAADDVGDAHVGVVHHHRQVVGRGAVGAADDEVIQFRVVEGHAPADQVIDHHQAGVRVAEADDVGLGGIDLAAAAAAVVARLELGRHLLLAQGVQALLGAIAAIGQALGEQFVDDRVVPVEALGLVEGSLVIVQPQPGHALQDGVDRLRRRPLQVRVLDAQHEAPPVAAGEEVGEEGGTGATDV